MLSFFSKKRRLIKRLWKLRRAYTDLDENVLQKNQINSKIHREFLSFKSWFFKILTNFALQQLENLLLIVLSEGSTVGDCIFIDTNEFFGDAVVKNNSPCPSSFAKANIKNKDLNSLIIDEEKFELTNFIVKTFCRPELTSSSSISPLPWCRQEETANNMICVNPYHFGVLHASDVQQQQQRRLTPASDVFVKRNVVEVDTSTSSSGCCDLNYVSDTTGTCRTLSCVRHSTDNAKGSIGSSSNQRDCSAAIRRKRAWCHMAYWEQNVRVGELLSVVDQPLAYCYFTLPVALPATNSLNLEKFERVDRNETILRTRQKIGRGFVLYVNKSKRNINKKDLNDDDVSEDSNFIRTSTDGGDVLLHNRGPSTLFVRSNYLHKESAIRLQPGYTLLVDRFDCNDNNLSSSTSTNLVNYETSDVVHGPQNPPSVLISFSKCWGKNYSRTFITCCPCWVEVIFAR